MADTCRQCRDQAHRRCLNPTTCPCHVCRRLTWSKPPDGPGRVAWVPDEILRGALRAAAAAAVPGSGDEWAAVWDFPTPAAATHAVTRVRSGKVNGLVKGHWDARSARTAESRGRLWLRYIGPSE